MAEVIASEIFSVILSALVSSFVDIMSYCTYSDIQISRHVTYVLGLNTREINSDDGSYLNVEAGMMAVIYIIDDSYL